MKPFSLLNWYQEHYLEILKGDYKGTGPEVASKPSNFVLKQFTSMSLYCIVH